MISVPFNVPYIKPNSIEYVNQVFIRKFFQGGGDFSKKCVNEIEAITKLSDLYLTASCTQALEMASVLLEISKGDEVIMPAFNFTSSALAVANFGAIPIFVDIDSRTKNIDPVLIERSITKRTKAISVINYAGVACNYIIIKEIAEKYSLALIEDNAHGFGAFMNGDALGGFGDLSAHSFHETKNIQCGEGGFLAVNNKALTASAQIASDKGTNRQQFLAGAVDKYTWQGLGGSYLLPEILASLLYSQLVDFYEIQNNRIQTWNTLDSELSVWAEKMGVSLPYLPTGNTNIAHMYYLVFKGIGIRNKFLAHMADKGIDVRFHFQCLDSTPAGKRYGKAVAACDISSSISNGLIRLPLWYGMDSTQIERVVEGCKSFKI